MHQRALMRIVGVPVIAREMLVIPGELAGIRIDRNRGIAVQIRRRRPRGPIRLAVVPRRALIRHRIRDAPVDHFAHRIVAPRQSPRRRQAILYVRAAPAFIARFAQRRSRVKLPQLFPRLGIVRRYKAIVAIPRASSAADHFAFDDQRTRSVPAPARLRLPARLARARVQADHRIRRRVQHDVVVNRQAFRASLARHVGGDFARVFPNEIARHRVERLHHRARIHDVHHAVMHHGDSFSLADSHAALPRQP